MKETISSVENYIAGFPTEVQERLLAIRKAILECAPNAVESIAYGMPAYKLNKKPLVYFAGYPNHIGFYATPTGHEKFKEKLASFKQGKGSVQFPLTETLPIDLIIEIIQFRVKENLRVSK